MSHFLQHLRHQGRAMPSRHVFAYINSPPITCTLCLLLFFPFSLPYSKQRLHPQQLSWKPTTPVHSSSASQSNSRMASLLSALSVYFVFWGKKIPRVGFNAAFFMLICYCLKRKKKSETWMTAKRNNHTGWSQHEKKASVGGQSDILLTSLLLCLTLQLWKSEGKKPAFSRHRQPVCCSVSEAHP